MQAGREIRRRPVGGVYACAVCARSDSPCALAQDWWRLLETVLPHPDIQLGARETETLRRARLVPAHFLQDPRDGLPLDDAQIGRGDLSHRGRESACGQEREMVGVDKAAFREDRG